MSAIDIARHLIQQSEGLRLVAYWDPDGKVWTVGYGATGPAIQKTTAWTQEQADSDLQERLNLLFLQLQQRIQGWSDLSPTRQAAILDWTYNLGLGRLLGSTLYKMLQSGSLDCVPTELAKWVNAGGHKLAGLVIRRQAEIALWNQVS